VSLERRAECAAWASVWQGRPAIRCRLGRPARPGDRTARLFTLSAADEPAPTGIQVRIITSISAGNKPLKNRPRRPMRGTMRRIADGEDYPMPATIDDPAVLKEIEEALHKSG